MAGLAPRPGNAPAQRAVLDALVVRGPTTLDALVAGLTLPRKEIARAAGRLILRGLADRLEAGLYQPTADGARVVAEGRLLTSGPRGRHTGPRRPPRDTLRQRAWTAMRVMGRFTVPDLVVAAGRPGEADPGANIAVYLRALAGAGYVAALPVRARGTAPTSNGFKVFRLLRDSGAIAPALRRAERALRDPNTGEVRPCS